MAKFHLSNRAVTDLSDIAGFTIQTFGIEQARFYRDGLNNCFEILAENPQLGRNAAELAPNLKRFEYQSHVVFYKPPGFRYFDCSYFASANGFHTTYIVFHKITMT